MVALDSSRLSAAIYDAWTGSSASGLSPNLTTSQKAMLVAQCDAIAKAVVDEIVGHAEVSVASVSGVSSGNASSGSGTGTIT